MDSGYYAAFTGLVARFEALDLVANNLANVNTTGFRGQRDFYRAVSASLGHQPLSLLNQAINNFGVLGGSQLDLRQGNLQSTGNSLDAAISGPGYFVVQSRGGVRYTRNGSFHLDANGQLVNNNEEPVLGPNGPILLAPGEVAIGPDGTISVAGATAAQLRLAEFSSSTTLVPEGNSNFIAPPNSEIPAANSQVQQGMLESSNISPVAGMIALTSLQRHTEMLERALGVFQNDFDKTAILDLARD